MGKREELDTALVEALADLAQAEAELARTVVHHTKVAPPPAEGDAELEHARAACRQARARLLQLERAMPAPSSDEQIEKPSRQADKLPTKPSRHWIANTKLRRAFPGAPALARAVPDWRSIARQAVMLLALVLAYLQYYFLDVQLEVSRLPSISTPFLG